MKARVLFVDDEPALLSALRNLFRKERDRWDMTFAIGAERALEELAASPADVVVSDMRMPGMDGAAFLAEVKRTHPATARIVLSGHADRASILRALPVAHQFFSKPCDAGVLRGAIARACALRERLDDAVLRCAIGACETLPSAPEAHAAIVRAAADKAAGLDELTRIAASDPAMSAKILQLVNSAYFGSNQRIVSIRAAVRYLGIDLVKRLVVEARVLTTVDVASPEAQRVSALCARATRAAHLARGIIADPAREDDAFTAALLHPIGALVTGDEGAAEAQAGSYLLALWGLPDAIVDSVARADAPSGDLQTAVQSAWRAIADDTLTARS